MWSLSIVYIMYSTWWTLWFLILASFYIGIMSLEPSTWGHYLAILFFFSSYIFTCQLVVVVLLTLTRCIGDTCLLTILTYIKNYNPKLLVIIIIIIIHQLDNIVAFWLLPPWLKTEHNIYLHVSMITWLKSQNVQNIFYGIAFFVRCNTILNQHLQFPNIDRACYTIN